MIATNKWLSMGVTPLAIQQQHMLAAIDNTKNNEYIQNRKRDYIKLLSGIEAKCEPIFNYEDMAGTADITKSSWRDVVSRANRACGRKVFIPHRKGLDYKYALAPDWRDLINDAVQRGLL